MKSSAQIRILMLVENTSYPQDCRVRQEANTLVSSGRRVTVISQRLAGQPASEEINGVKVYRYTAPGTANGFWGYMLEYGYAMGATFFISLLVAFRPGFDVVHAHNPPDTFVLIAAFYKLFGKRFVFDHHDLSPEMYYARFGGKGSSLVHRSLAFFEKLSCRLADHVITTNQSYKLIEVERCGVPDARISIVRNGPDMNFLKPQSNGLPTATQGKTVLGYVGDMGFHDGLDYLLRTIAHLVYELGRTNVSCTLIGGGDAWTELKSMAQELRLDQHVSFTGVVEHEKVPSLLSTADICLSPEPSNSYNDNSTMIKLMEYMALGKPVVAFDLPEHRVTAGDAALYVTPNDETEFARTISILMDDPERRESMGKIGRRRIETELAWQHQGKNLLKVYTALG